MMEDVDWLADAEWWFEKTQSDHPNVYAEEAMWRCLLRWASGEML